MQSINCEPTLNDSQVLEFCKQGYLLLDSVVPAEINERVAEYRLSYPEVEVHQLLKEQWFVEGVLLNPAVAGAVRSLLGPEAYLPHLIFSHRNQAPFHATGWHRDGHAIHGNTLNYLQLFYYPQDATPELGPTEFLPGSQFLYSPSRNMAHYDSIAGSIISSAPAGSVWITHYGIWHRRPDAAGQGLRDVLKYCYFRKNAPQRDWIHQPGFSAKTADYSSSFGPTFREQFRECVDASQLFEWMSGNPKVPVMGGQAWYVPATYPSDDRYGYPYES